MQGAAQSSNLNLRIPSWTHTDGAKASLNDQSLNLPAPGVNFSSISSSSKEGNNKFLRLSLFFFFFFPYTYFLTILIFNCIMYFILYIFLFSQMKKWSMQFNLSAKRSFGPTLWHLRSKLQSFFT